MSKYFNIPFAENGDKTTVPDPTQGTGGVSYNEGFGPDYEANQDTDPNAKDIGRSQYNQLLNDITGVLKEAQENGVLPWRNDIDYEIGSYVKGTDSNVYYSLTVSGPSTSPVDPVGDLTGAWVVANTITNDGVDTGVADAYVIERLDNSIGVPPSALYDGYEVSFFALNDNTNAAPTADAFGLGSKTITLEDGAALSSGDIKSDVMTTLRYDANSDTQLLIRGSGLNKSSILSGSVIWFAGSVVPSGFLECDGSSLLVATYSELFSAIGYTFGGAGPNFNLPDLRGEFVRGWDNGRGVDIGRVFGSSQTDEIRSHTHTLNNGGNTVLTNTGAGLVNQGLPSGSALGVSTLSNTGGTESRPRNIALLPCIKF